MFFDSSRRAIDFPAPPTPDEVAARFPVPLMALVAQDTLEETSVSGVSQSSNHRVTMQTVALTYTLWRNPADHGDPANLADLTEDVRAGLDSEPLEPLPEWMWIARERMRYPALWEAVRTTHLGEGERWRTAASTLVEHANYIITNRFRDERVRGGFPGELVDAVTEDDLDPGARVAVDGKSVAGVRLVSDPHVIGVAADLGDRLLTAVIAREHAPHILFEFETRGPHAQR